MLMPIPQYILLLAFAALAIAIAAAADGLVETLLHHYPAFAARFPANPYWWNPALSWPNKGSGFLSRTLLVWTTDAYHCFRFASRVLLVLGTGMFALTSPLPFSRIWWKWAALVAVAMAAAWLVGFYAVYSWIF